MHAWIILLSDRTHNGCAVEVPLRQILLSDLQVGPIRLPQNSINIFFLGGIALYIFRNDLSNLPLSIIKSNHTLALYRMRQEYSITGKYLNTAFLDNKHSYFDEQNLLISLLMPYCMKF